MREVGGSVEFELFEIGLVVVRDAVVPAAPEYAQPLKSETAEDRLAALLPFALVGVVRLGPVAIAHGQAGPLDQCLAGELGRIPAPVDPPLPPAFFNDWSDAIIL